MSLNLEKLILKWKYCILKDQGQTLIILERKGVDDWVSACRNVVVAEVRWLRRDRKTWGMC